MCFGLNDKGQIISGYTGRVDWTMMKASDEAKKMMVPEYKSPNQQLFPWFNNNKYNYNTRSFQFWNNFIENIMK